MNTNLIKKLLEVSKEIEARQKEIRDLFGECDNFDSALDAIADLIYTEIGIDDDLERDSVGYKLFDVTVGEMSIDDFIGYITKKYADTK